MAVDVSAQHRGMMELLCKAAGLDPIGVERIECVCERDRLTKFNVEFIGSAKVIEKVLIDDAQQQR